MFKHLCCKEDCAELQKEIRETLRTLLLSATPKEFDENWQRIQEDWADQKAWLKYLEKEWINVKERWAHPWRKVAFNSQSSIYVFLTVFLSMCTMELILIILLRAGMLTSRKTILGVHVPSV